MKALFKVPRRLTSSELHMARHIDKTPLKRGAVSNTDFFYVTKVTDERVFGYEVDNITKEQIARDRKLLANGKFHLFQGSSGAGPAYYLKDRVEV